MSVDVALLLEDAPPVQLQQTEHCRICGVSADEPDEEYPIVDRLVRVVMGGRKTTACAFCIEDHKRGLI